MRKVRITDDAGFWLAFSMVVAVMVAGAIVGTAYRQSHLPDRDAVVCKLNKGVPLIDYYGDFHCVMENK